MSGSEDDCEEDMEEDFESTYYQADGYGDDDSCDSTSATLDPEHFDFKSLSTEEVEKLLNEGVAELVQLLHITPALAKLLLHFHKWNTENIVKRFRTNAKLMLAESQLLPQKTVQTQSLEFCEVCLNPMNSHSLIPGSCGHSYCKHCWTNHIEIQIQLGHSTSIECMGEGCNILLAEDLVLNLIENSRIREKYQRFAFEEYVNKHPSLRFCPGPGCTTVIHAREKKARRVICSQCKAVFCFGCGTDYHAPTACDVIRRWLTKCIDDSETANYISANTKDCPKCNVCIEKNGGCNHMQCSKCKLDFCWMCLGDWKAHGSEYYECSRYKENPNLGKYTNNDKCHQAREALLKYLHYFTRWENHANSLKLEAQEREDICKKIQQKVLSKQGTWIDWQYLVHATELLRKCRYTLQYTYPYAYYLEKGPSKELFEYQQGKLEAEVENLSWKIQKAEITDRGDLENQMNVAEKMRLTLLKDFLQS